MLKQHNIEGYSPQDKLVRREDDKSERRKISRREILQNLGGIVAGAFTTGLVGCGPEQLAKILQEGGDGTETDLEKKEEEKMVGLFSLDLQITDDKGKPTTGPEGKELKFHNFSLTQEGDKLLVSYVQHSSLIGNEISKNGGTLVLHATGVINEIFLRPSGTEQPKAFRSFPAGIDNNGERINPLAQVVVEESQVPGYTYTENVWIEVRQNEYNQSDVYIASGGFPKVPETKRG